MKGTISCYNPSPLHDIPYVGLHDLINPAWQPLCWVEWLHKSCMRSGGNPPQLTSSVTRTFLKEDHELIFKYWLVWREHPSFYRHTCQTLAIWETIRIITLNRRIAVMGIFSFIYTSFHKNQGLKYIYSLLYFIAILSPLLRSISGISQRFLTTCFMYVCMDFMMSWHFSKILIY